MNSKLHTGEVIFDADEGFGEAALFERAGAKPGRFHCADRVAVRPEEKRGLFEETEADAVEMESG